MSGDGEDELSAFVALHGAALRASRVPTRYWESLCRKLRGEVGGRGPLPVGTALWEPSCPRPRAVFPAEGASLREETVAGRGVPSPPFPSCVRSNPPFSAMVRGAWGAGSPTHEPGRREPRGRLAGGGGGSFVPVMLRKPQPGTVKEIRCIVRI